MFHTSVSDPSVLVINNGLKATNIDAKNPATSFINFLPIKNAAIAAITASIVGSMQGKVGASMPQIKGLELVDGEEKQDSLLSS